MIRLSEPQFSYQDTLSRCITGITGNTDLKKKLQENSPDIIAVEAQYIAAASGGKLHTIHPINGGKADDPDVIKTVKKSELIKVYNQYFVAAEKPARKIYNALLNSAKEKCPFCGGIGSPRNLDHFLPKAHFPQFSILPRNLIFACRDCNMDGKADDFAANEEDQIIQPYLDNDRFFLEQWIFANYKAGNKDEPGEFEYYVLAPDAWAEVNKQRVRKHFEDFSLAKRYATKAAERLGTVLIQIKSMEQLGLNNREIKSVLEPEVNNALFVNHWQKGMFQALIDELI
ncbi:MAG: HNH endonuclease [Pirellulales bacterium]